MANTSSGITKPPPVPQQQGIFAAYDVTAENRAELTDLFRTQVRSVSRLTTSAGDASAVRRGLGGPRRATDLERPRYLHGLGHDRRPCGQLPSEAETPLLAGNPSTDTCAYIWVRSTSKTVHMRLNVQ